MIMFQTFRLGLGLWRVSVEWNDMNEAEFPFFTHPHRGSRNRLQGWGLPSVYL